MTETSERTAIITDGQTYVLMCGACYAALENRGAVTPIPPAPDIQHFHNRYIVARVTEPYSLQSLEELRDHSLHT